MAGELPGVKVKPIIGNLDLVAVDNLLLEDSVSVPQTVAPSGEIKRGKAVEEASGKPTKATIAQSSIVLLADNVLNAEAQISKPS